MVAELVKWARISAEYIVGDAEVLKLGQLRKKLSSADSSPYVASSEKFPAAVELSCRSSWAKLGPTNPKAPAPARRPAEKAGAKLSNRPSPTRSRRYDQGRPLFCSLLKVLHRLITFAVLLPHFAFAITSLGMGG
ncbi:hypothetical protein P154DRAFT_296118 [Amniculicola lignicola CBS 123094]|uniref:Uncharacterized protein n=1 Tax=Amniculicola lignicola CBS 123094 TaxID=1392246 RepID=A0A6A5W789_9PLEO|nr:hypothetical protein P154DRAFT_296118 [Amniculicola lignicola CBS 123094]